MLGRKRSFAVLLLVVFLSACGSAESHGCDRPPKEGFSESDLIGTWSALGSRGDSTITIRGDGRYRQTMRVERQGFNYKSDWRRWWTSYSERGLPYVHFEGLLMCTYWRTLDCTEKDVPTIGVGDTKDPFGDVTYWYDYCQSKWVNTPGEAVFMVFEGGKLAPRGIRLVPFTKSSDGVTGPDFLQEP